jgi:hypothetical protein
MSAILMKTNFTGGLKSPSGCGISKPVPASEMDANQIERAAIPPEITMYSRIPHIGWGLDLRTELNIRYDDNG